MAFIDLFIGSFVLPLRYINAYRSPLTSKLCTTLGIGESCALSAMIYTIVLMIYIRLYNLKRSTFIIHHCYIILLLLSSCLILCLFYGIPFMAYYSTYPLSSIKFSTSNTTTYCTTYPISIYHGTWMSYLEIGIIYIVPIILIWIGLVVLLCHLCQSKPRHLKFIERKIDLERRQMTWHVFLLSFTFVLLCLPWISIRINIIIVHSSLQFRRILQITYYILLLRSALFPIIYASTNPSFRGSFAVYRHQRTTMNNLVWTTD